MKDHDRIVLLFDLDCFYAQCERVRLGLEKDAKLALLQWNSVLAVTYPARKFGIKRGDSWEDVSQKSNGACHAIHLHILQTEQQQRQHNTTDDDDDEDDHHDNIQVAFDKMYKLSPEQQLEARKDLGKQRFHYEGKACLERYRLASMSIFAVVLESLTRHLEGKDRFVVERASIDEFYLDITKYCYDKQRANSNLSVSSTINHPKTVVVGNSSVHESEDSSRKDALHRACQVSHWIRTDVWNALGFTMSSGISTNKTMAKLAASYGKPNGQAVLHPHNFGNIMNTTMIRKVRNFGGKLGKEVIRKVLEGKEDATMGNLAQVPLPLLQHHLSQETAQFVYSACRGIDCEAVKETAGALVKSITAFKSFTATTNRREIQKWLDIIVEEIVTRVSKDTARNKRYPKSCTLNYTYYSTPSGKRPTDGTHRTQRNTKSVRLDYPNDRHPQKAHVLKQQAMERLLPILAKHPLRGVGLSANNFENRGQPPAGVASIDNFFSAAKTTTSSTTTTTTTPTSVMEQSKKSLQEKPAARGAVGMHFPTTTTKESTPSSTFSTLQDNDNHSKSTYGACQKDSSCPSATEKDLAVAKKRQASFDQGQPTVQQQQQGVSTKDQGIENSCPPSITDKDIELAKKLQASFDREHYVLTAANRRSDTTGGPAKKKPRRIDGFFQRR
jgi:DNA polymerase eta